MYCSCFSDLTQGIDIESCWIEVSVHQHSTEPKHRSIRKILGLSSGSSANKSQSSSNFELPSGAGSQAANIRIPIASVAFSSEERFPKPWGT